MGFTAGDGAEKTRRALSIVAALFVCVTAHAQLADRVDAIAREALSHPGAGISIAISRNGQTIFARGYGLANIEHAVAVTPETVFHIDSISKNILAAAILRLVDEGKLQLDDEVTKWVPEAPVQGRHLTVRHLLNHTSGIYSFTSLPDAEANERSDLDHAQVLALIKGKPFAFEPGTRWRYDNTGFYLAGMVVERVTKQDYGAYVREHLFKPAKMIGASLCDARTIVPHLASGYTVDGGELVHTWISWKLPWAAGAVCATANDLLAYQTALDSGALLKSSSLAIMRTPTTIADGTKIDYGLGTRLGSLDGHRVVGHTGSGGGFRSALVSFPDDHLTIAVLMNTDNGSNSPLAMASAIARIVLELPRKPLLDDPVPESELAMVTGSFDSDEGPAENFARDGRLHFRIPGTPIEGVLRRQSANVYALDENSEVHLIVRDGRAVIGLLYSGGLLMDVKYRVEH